jgi:hypothetical protein
MFMHHNPALAVTNQLGSRVEFDYNPTIILYRVAPTHLKAPFGTATVVCLVVASAIQIQLKNSALRIGKN